MFELFASLGPGETIFLIVALCVTAVMTARYIFNGTDEFGHNTTSEMSALELKQIVHEAVEEKVAPLQARIEEVEETQSQQLAESESRRSLADSSSSSSEDG
jgi:hypothetical protein